MRHYLGVDLGSSAIKLTLLTEQGDIAAISSREYDTIYPKPGWAEQDPEIWVRGFIASFRELIATSGINPKDIKALAISAATHTAVLLDENFRPVRNAIFWTDQRSAAQSDALAREHGDSIFQKTYHYPDTMWTLPQVQWIRQNQPEVYARARHILFAKDYLRYRLTPNYCTDSIDALGSMLFNAETNAWDAELCGMIGFRVEDMPTVVQPTDIVGTVSAEMAEATGLGMDTVVVAGASDTALEVFAAGAVRPGQMTVKLATSGRICVITEKAHPDRLLVNYRHVVDGLWYPGTGTRSCASSYRWFKDTFGQCESGESRRRGSGESAYDLLNRQAAGVPLGSEGLFYHPYLLGEFVPYRDPLLRASFVGATMKHGKGHFVRAVLEGICFSLLDCLSAIRRMDLPDAVEARVIGGGAQSPLWRAMLCDMLGLPISRVEADDSSFGAAMLAAVAVGQFRSPAEAAAQCVKLADRTQPDRANHKKYLRRFALYKKIQTALAPLYHEMAALQDDR